MKKKSLGVIFTGEGRTRSLLFVLERSGTWSFPKGRLESRELPLDGLRREVHEETGIDLGLIRHSLSEAKPIVISKKKHFVFIVKLHKNRSHLHENPIDVFEIREVRWVRFSDLRRVQEKWNLNEVTRTIVEKLLQESPGRPQIRRVPGRPPNESPYRSPYKNSDRRSMIPALKVLRLLQEKFSIKVCEIVKSFIFTPPTPFKS